MPYTLGPISITGSVVSINGPLQITGSITTTQNIQTTASWANNALTASYITSSFFTGTNAALSASYALTASYAMNGGGTTINTGSFATTGSNTFNGNQTISGSLIIQQNLTVFGSSSITNVSSSTLNVGTNLITVNTFNPTNRFGGLAIIDSGSSPQVSASFLYDSIQDEFVFVHRGASTAITSSHFLVGPETYNNLGNEIYISTNSILKSQGNEHVTASNITDTGTIVSINSNTQITGSAIITGSMTVTSLTPNRALMTDANDQLISSATTNTELGYLSGVTSAIQTQLNSKVYTVFFFSNAWTIVAGTTYYIGNFPRNPTTTVATSRVHIPKAGTITDAIFQIYSAGVIGSNNGITASIRLNNTTDYLIEQNAVAVANRTFTNNSLSIPVVVGDYIEMKMQIATPYTTVPTNNFPTANILIRS